MGYFPLAPSLRSTQDKSMKCPHCLTDFFPQPELTPIGTDDAGVWGTVTSVCPSCNRLSVTLVNAGEFVWKGGRPFLGQIKNEWRVFPRGASRPPPPKEVPEALAADYLEACVVFSDSERASAALSRRCLQQVLREKGGVEHGLLADEIQQVLDSGNLPTYVAEALELVRSIGHFEARPEKSRVAGEIAGVEPGEAEWNLNVLETLFDFYYVLPTALDAKREALEAKLKQSIKPPEE